MSIKIFLADDHAIVRDGLRMILETAPDLHVIGTAGDGLSAVAQVQTLGPDVVVMDISMPRMNGIEATQHIRQDCPTTQVVILSVHSTVEHISRALQAGALGYLLKESAGSEVVDAVRAVQAGCRYLSQAIAAVVIEDYSQPRNSPAENKLAQLSLRERQVLQFIAEGMANVEIAKTLSLSPKTIETYRSRLMRKLGVSDFHGLVKFAIQHRLISPD